MMRQIIGRNDSNSHHSKQVLLTAVNTHRPLRLSELITLATSAALPKFANHRNIVRFCGLLTISEDDKIFYFVHQSAKDYLIKYAKSNIMSEIFPRERLEGHCAIVSQSLKAMAEPLRRNVYNLEYPGVPIADVKAPNPDPLAPIRYACVYWVDHLCETDNHDKVGLHWLEALSLMRSISDGVFAIAKLVGLLRVGRSFNTYRALRNTN